MQVDEVVSATGVKREAPPDAGDAAAAVEKKQIAANPAGDKDPLERARKFVFESLGARDAQRRGGGGGGFFESL